MLRICKWCKREYNTVPECDKRQGRPWRHDCHSIKCWQSWMAQKAKDGDCDLSENKDFILK